MTEGVLFMIVISKARQHDPKECEMCGDEFVPVHGRQQYCPTCREYLFGMKYHPNTGGPTDLNSNENAIRRRFEEKERNCTIVGEGYAERQIEETLRLAGKVKTEL